MRISRVALAFAICLFVSASCLLHAQGGSDQEIRASCRAFVQEFYNWYVPIALKDSTEPSSNVALRQRAASFEPELLRLLQEDAAANAGDDEIVGLDFDPFLSSQDPSHRFVVEEVVQKEGRCFAEVRGIQAGKKQEKVVAELVWKDGHWLFADFHYPPNGDLLAGLESAHKERSEQPKKTH